MEEQQDTWHGFPGRGAERRQSEGPTPGPLAACHPQRRGPSEWQRQDATPARNSASADRQGHILSITLLCEKPK